MRGFATGCGGGWGGSDREGLGGRRVARRIRAGRGCGAGGVAGRVEGERLGARGRGGRWGCAGVGYEARGGAGAGPGGAGSEVNPPGRKAQRRHAGAYSA